MFGRTSQQDEQRAIVYRDWLQQRNPLAIASLVLGVFSLVEAGALVVPEIAGIVLGVMSLIQLRRENSVRPRGHGLAYGGIGLSVVSLILAAYLYFSRPHG